MNLTFELQERPSNQIKELRLLHEEGNEGVYKIYTQWLNAPELAGYMRIIYNIDDDYSIDGLDFDGGPMIYPGYKLDNNNEITKIYRDELTKEILVKVKNNNYE